MHSFRRLISSRANGRLSRGPKTDTGKRRSSQNARVHGCRSRTFLPPEEKQSRREFDQLRRQFFTTFAPQNDAESLYVGQMFQAHWRETHLVELKSRILDDVVASHPAGHFGNDDQTPTLIYLEAMKNARFRCVADYEVTESLRFLRALCKFDDARYHRRVTPTKKTTSEPTLELPYVTSELPQPPLPQQHPAAPPPHCHPWTPPERTQETRSFDAFLGSNHP